MHKISSERIAKMLVRETTEPKMVIMGDDGFFWVVSICKGFEFIRQGLERVR